MVPMGGIVQCFRDLVLEFSQKQDRNNGKSVNEMRDYQFLANIKNRVDSADAVLGSKLTVLSRWLNKLPRPVNQP